MHVTDLKEKQIFIYINTLFSSSKTHLSSCLVKSFLYLYPFRHFLHWNGFSLEWALSWNSNLYWEIKDLKHTWQVYNCLEWGEPWWSELWSLYPVKDLNVLQHGSHIAQNSVLWLMIWWIFHACLSGNPIWWQILQLIL